MYGQNFPNNPYSYNAPSMPFMPDFRASQPNQQTQPTNITWVYVSGLEGARSQIVQPGQTVWMMDNNDPAIYVKAVDSTGTATLKAFRLTEINAQNSPSSTPPIDLKEYVNKSELDGILCRIKALEDTLGGLNA